MDGPRGGPPPQALDSCMSLYGTLRTPGIEGAAVTRGRLLGCLCDVSEADDGDRV